MDNKEGNMENDLNNFGEVENTAEISEVTARKLGETTGKAVDVDKLIEQTDIDVHQKIKNGDLSAAYEQFEDGREVIQEAGNS